MSYVKIYVLHWCKLVWGFPVFRNGITHTLHFVEYNKFCALAATTKHGRWNAIGTVHANRAPFIPAKYLSMISIIFTFSYFLLLPCFSYTNAILSPKYSSQRIFRISLWSIESSFAAFTLIILFEIHIGLRLIAKNRHSSTHRQTSPIQFPPLRAHASNQPDKCECFASILMQHALERGGIWIGLVCRCVLECRCYLPIEGHMGFCQNLD